MQEDDMKKYLKLPLKLSPPLSRGSLPLLHAALPEPPLEHAHGSFQAALPPALPPHLSLITSVQGKRKFLRNIYNKKRKNTTNIF